MAELRSSSIGIEVVYALPHEQTAITLTVPVGTSITEALAISGIAERHPEVDWDSVAVGIFGRRVSKATVLEQGDRVEIYRRLIADPKQARRNRARGGLKDRSRAR